MYELYLVFILKCKQIKLMAIQLITFLNTVIITNIKQDPTYKHL